ncbi:hypothetical protein CHN50_21385, partial [Priestia aryabhattai]
MLQKITFYVLFFCAISSFILLNVTGGWQIELNQQKHCLHLYHSIPNMLQKITFYVLFFCAISSFILLNVTGGWQIE